MNPQETQQVAARDEKWVTSAERVKINSTNIRLETTVPQKEETFQVITDVINNSTCFRAFAISADVPKIFMQQFWYTIKKVQDTDSYEFLLANKSELENVDYPELIWEDLAYQIDYKKEKRSRRENMPYPRFTKIIINHFLKQHKSLTNLNHKHFHTIKYDGINHIKCSSNIQQIKFPPKKSRGKGSKGKKTAEESQETVDVSEESEPEPEPTKKKTSVYSQTKVEEVEAARKVHATHARIVSESVPESAKNKYSGKSSNSVVIQDTPSAPKSKPATSKSKLKGAPSLTLAEQEAANIMQALKESKKTSRRQPGTGGSNEGTGSKPGVPDESTAVSATSSEGIGAKPGVLDEDKEITEEKVILEWGDEHDSEFSDEDSDDDEKDDKDVDADDEADDHVSDTQDADDEDDETESDEDEIYKYKIRVRNKEDVEMKEAEGEESDKGEEKVTDAAKEEAEKTSEAKDDTKKYEPPPSSSSLYVSSGFGDQFLKLSSESSLVSTVKDFADADVISTAVPSPQVTPIVSSVQQTPTPIPTPPITTDAPTVTTAIPESNALSAVELRVTKLEKDMSELKTVDHSSKALAVLQSYVLTVVDSYLDTKVRDVFQKELQKHTVDLIHKYSLQHLPELTKKPTPTTEQESEISPSEILKIKKEQAESQKNPQFTIKSTDKAALEENPANHRLYHALMEALIEDENAIDKGVADTVKDYKRKHDDEDDDDEDPLARLNQGKKTKRRRTKDSESLKKPSTTKETLKCKAPTKGSKVGKSASAKELVEEPIAEVIMDDAGDDVAHDDNPPQDTSEPKTRKTLNLEWFKQPPRPPTPDPE
ncbi:hypothetical protein Tco_1531996 [Tanacetum coccineum]